MLNKFLRAIKGLLTLLYQASPKGEKVVKVYESWRAIKWLPAKLLFPFFPYSLSPTERAAREALFLLSELPTPELVSLGKGFLVRKYLEGDVLGPDGKEVARALWRAHSLCWALGDAKFDNFLVKGGDLYYIDGEQATRTCDPLRQGVDLVEAAFFLMLFGGCKQVKLLLENYPGREQKKVFLLPTGALLVLPCLHVVLKGLREGGTKRGLTSSS